MPTKVISLKVIFDNKIVYNVIIFKILPVSSETTQCPLSFNNPFQFTNCILHQVNQKLQSKVRCKFTLLLQFCPHYVWYITIDLMPKLKKNILNFRYGANFKYEGMLTHSFDGFYVVTKYEIPRVEQLQFTTLLLT